MRAFDRNHLVVAQGVVTEQTALVDKVGEFSSGTEADYVHIHYAGPGCF